MAQEDSVKHRSDPIPKMPVRAENIPALLKSYDRWLNWQWNWDGGKWDKPPLKYDGSPGSSTNPKTWTTFATALKASERFSGVGYAINKGDGLVGIDIDHCRDEKTGEISAFALAIIKDLDTYAEISPSGTGVKLWLEGEIPDEANWAKVNRADDLEIYCGGRYFTVTGHCVGEPKPIAKAGNQLKHFLINHMRKTEVYKDRPKDPAHTIEVAKQAIMEIDPNCDYLTWVNVGMALNWLSDSLFEVWDNWSAGAGGENYPGTETCLQKWKSFSGAKSKVTIGTLFHHAKAAGFKMPATMYENSDYGVARRVRDAAESRMYYIHEWGKWYAWNGRSFVEDRVNAVAEKIVATSKQMMVEVPKASSGDKKADDAADKAWHGFCMKYQSARGISDVSKLARGLMNLDYRDLDRNPMLFHCENGYIDLLNDEQKFFPHSHEHLNTMLSGVVYDPNATCPRWERFIEEVTEGDEELANYLQAIFGYCLSGRIDYQAVFILHGSGQNGKGVFTRMLLKILGEYGGPVSQDLLMAAPNQHPTQFAYLYGKRCVIAQETDQDCRLNENQIKALTGGDNIQCRRMREDFWEFAPTHKIFLATNHMPLIRGSDHGIWRRVKLIPFRAKFDGKTNDPQLDATLNAETSGILNWALKGWGLHYRWNNWTINEPKVVLAALDEYREEMNVVQQFVMDMCVTGEKHSIATGKLYQAMKLYCEEHGLFLPSSRKFNSDLAMIGIENGRTKNTRLKLGLTLRSEFEDAPVKKVADEPLF